MTDTIILTAQAGEVEHRVTVEIRDGDKRAAVEAAVRAMRRVLIREFAGVDVKPWFDLRLRTRASLPAWDPKWTPDWEWRPS